MCIPHRSYIILTRRVGGWSFFPSTGALSSATRLRCEDSSLIASYCEQWQHAAVNSTIYREWELFLTLRTKELTDHPSRALLLLGTERLHCPIPCLHPTVGTLVAWLVRCSGCGMMALFGKVRGTIRCWSSAVSHWPLPSLVLVLGYWYWSSAICHKSHDPPDAVTDL